MFEQKWFQLWIVCKPLRVQSCSSNETERRENWKKFWIINDSIKFQQTLLSRAATFNKITRIEYFQLLEIVLESFVFAFWSCYVFHQNWPHQQDMTTPTRRQIQRHRHEMLTLETIETWQLRVTLECIWFFSMFSRRPINLKFLCKPKLESECAKVGQISSEIRLIACQKHLYGASKNINFILLHHGRIFVYWNHLWPNLIIILIFLGFRHWREFKK